MYNQASIYKGGGVYKMGEASALPYNYEKPKRYAVVGDAVYADANGNVHFIVGQSVKSSAIPADWEFVGPIAIREGDKATILYKTETEAKWASMWLFKVNGLKLDGTDTFVLQQGPTSGSTPVEIGTFTATEAATDLDTLVSELDTWLRANPTATGALENYNWHAEKHEDADGVDSCFIVVDNFTLQALGNNTAFSVIKSSTSGTTAPLYMFDWVSLNVNSSYFIRKDGVSTSNIVWNKDIFKANNSNIGNTNDSLSNTGLLNKSTFNGTTVLKGYYGTYDNYLDYMTVDENASSGAYSLYKNKGKELAEGWRSVEFPNLAGTNTKVFTVEYSASTIKAHSTASVEGLNAGDFCVASIDQAFKICGEMASDGSDVLNSTIVKAGGSAYILGRTRWLPSRNTAYALFVLFRTGYTTVNGMPNAPVFALTVAEIDL